MELGGGISLIFLTTFGSVDMQTITFTTIAPADPSDTSNFLINLSSISPEVDSIISISDITADYWSISMITVSSAQQTNLVDQIMTLTNITYKNAYLYYSDDLIEFELIIPINTYQITINELTMQNITFERGGNLMYIQHQTNEQLILTNSVFQTITNAGILVDSFDQQQTDRPTKILMTNITVDDFDGQSSRFISANQGTILEVHDSTFTHITSLRSGAVLFAGKTQTTSELFNCTFINNTAVSGSVFNPQSESVIKCTDCVFQNNFAVIGGVIYSDDEGYFEFENW
jgi:hypothetical protein